MPDTALTTRLRAAHAAAVQALLAERTTAGHWEGELSTSALSTATAVMALEMVCRSLRQSDMPRLVNDAGVSFSVDQLQRLIQGGLAWLKQHQNPDGGWGDTTLSFSNISTTMLCFASFHAAAPAQPDAPPAQPGATSAGRAPHELPDSSRIAPPYQSMVEQARHYITKIGGVQAVRARYGRDHTFSVPILTHCALAGVVPWRDVAPLPFELACVPHIFYKWLRLPVVSYALPALIAIGNVRHHFRKPWNPLLRGFRQWAIAKSLRKLQSIQPESGGFLEATPLTAFVTMSLAGMGLITHPVTLQGVTFLVRSVRPDGSWPIDTNLATWVTTLSVNALGDRLPATDLPPLRDWLLGQQYRTIHPYTQADPGGWAWTDLSGGVPDADDTPSALLALLTIRRALQQTAPFASPAAFATPAKTTTPAQNTALAKATAPAVPDVELAALDNAVRWLLDLQNRDGGWPTFCKGWGTLPFDRSAPDLTAHALRALFAWQQEHQRHEPHGSPSADVEPRPFPLINRATCAIDRGFQYLARTQRADGSWLPLWFGNQRAPDDENPTYGTARVLLAYRDLDRLSHPAAQRGLHWLKQAQHHDGSWGAGPHTDSSIEETALALEALLSTERDGPLFSETCQRGIEWLMARVEDKKFRQPSPIGFYFAKLWYFEKLYPLIFTVAALQRAITLMPDERPA